jgi:cobaltochelatase CobN
MHRIAATPGGWNPQAEGVIFIEQSPAPIIFLTAADTDIQTLAAATSQLPLDFPALRVVNLLQLQQQLTIDTYAENVLKSAQIIIVRLLGGRAYWSYGLEVVQESVQQTGAALVVLPGDDRPDPDLIGHSTVSLAVVNQLWRYLTEGGVDNFANALKFVADVCLGHNYNPPSPQAVPRVGIYSRKSKVNSQKSKPLRGESPVPEVVPAPDAVKSQTPNPKSKIQNLKSKIGLLFYRAHYQAGNTAPIDALCQALTEQQLEPVPVFVSSLRDPDVQAELLEYFQPKEESGIELLLNTTSFSLAKLDAETPQLEFWQRLDVPVLQVIFSGGTVEQWESQFQGLTPRDTAMNVALPEVDGRIISRAVSFKSVQTWNPRLETDVVVYQAVRDRINFVADLAANWVRLRQTPPSQRRIALILANYPNRDGRLANGVGLDTPASCVEILKALQQGGYQVEDIPESGDALIQRLTAGVTNDPEGRELRTVQQQLSWEEYQQYFETLPPEVQKGMGDRWGMEGLGKSKVKSQNPYSPFPIPHSPFPIPGIQLGNVFVGIQPSRL